MIMQNGWSALMCASYNGEKDVVDLLIDAGVDINLQDNVIVMYQLIFV